MAVIVDLSQFEEINEENKEELIQWLQTNLEVMQDPSFDYHNRNVNRVFGVDNVDDIDQGIQFMGRLLVTLQRYVLLKK